MSPNHPPTATDGGRATDKSIAEVFSADVDKNGGYGYTATSQLSSRLATSRWIDACLDVGDFRDKTVLDIGCGDGTFTFQLYDRAHPRSMVSIDLAESALAAARSRAGDRNVTFQVGNATALDFPDDSFDVAWCCAVLHHIGDPALAVREALRVARQVVVLEPNGYSPILKILEKRSKYHIEHHEQSYRHSTMRGWVRDAGGEVKRSVFVGLVPMFCPDVMARTLKVIEPVVEMMPLVRRYGCALNVFMAERTESARVSKS